MKNSKIITLELQIKLLEYLKDNDYIDCDFYEYCVDRFITKFSKEKI